MKYFVGFLLQGEVAEWHKKIAKQISDKFDTWKIHEKLPPHITIFYLEGIEDVSRIKNYIRDWVKGRDISGNFYLTGFDNFDDRVIFAKVDADEKVMQEIGRLREDIRKVSGIENESYPRWIPHATLANKLDPQEIKNILEYTKTLGKPNFTTPFDNVTIFKFIGDRKWKIDEVFNF